MTVDRARLERLLGGADSRWLIDRVRERLERGGTVDGTATLRAPTDGQRAAVTALLGLRHGRGSALTVRLAQVEEVLRRSGVASGLREAVEALTGPLEDRAAARGAADRAWAAVFDDVDALADQVPSLRPWRDELVGAGLLRRVSGGDVDHARRLVWQCRAVVERLPERGVSRARLAAETAGDAHALDPGRPLATLALKAAACIGGVSWGVSADAQRTVWAGVGVLAGELGKPVLTLGLPGDPVSATGRALSVWRRAGQPVHLTLRQLVRDPPRLPAGLTVFVCENSSVVLHAADELGTRCAPLVCVESHPAAAQSTLLGLLRAAGADLRYHGDFDWAGIAIGNGVMRRFGARPWRYGTDDYHAAVAAGAGTPMQRRLVSAIWDDRLGPAMRRACRKVEEEHVMAPLLEDLTDRGARRALR
jgi:uncharacterized protein (TIGR02679 family)